MSVYRLRAHRFHLRWLVLGAVVLLALGVALAMVDQPEGSELFLGVSKILWSVLLWGIVLYYGFRGRTVADDRVCVANSLADMLEMGIPVDQAVQQQAFELQHRFTSRYTWLAGALPRVGRRLAQGSPLSVAIAGERSLPQFWRPVLHAAEARDALPEGLRAVARMERCSGMVSAGTMARLYVGLTTVILVGPFLSTYIFPTFVSLLENMGSSADAQSLGYLNLLWPVVVLCLFLLVLTSIPAVRHFLGGLLGWLPGGPRSLIRMQEQYLTCEALAAALRLELPLQDAYRLAAEVATRGPYRRALHQMMEGDSLSAGMSRYPGLFDATLCWLVAQSEALSTLPEALRTAATWYAAEAERLRHRLGVVVSAVLTIGLGTIVGYLCLATLGTIMQVVLLVTVKGVLP